MSSISFARRASKIKYCTAQLSELVCIKPELDSGLWTLDNENSIVFKKGK